MSILSWIPKSIVSVFLEITRICKCFLKSIADFYFFLNNHFFSQHIMMESPSLEKENRIRDVRNLFRLEKVKKETIDTTLKGIKNFCRPETEKEEIKDRIFRDIRNTFRLEKGNKTIKDIILRDIINLFEKEEEQNNYNTVGVNNFWSNNYNEYKSNADWSKTPSFEEYFNKIRPYLKDTNNVKKSGTWKIQLTIASNFISYLDKDVKSV